MKNTILLILGILGLSNLIQAQSTCGYKVYSEVISNELTDYQTDFTLNAHFKFRDSLKFIGSPQMDSSLWFSFTGHTMPSTSIYFVDDSLVFSFDLSTDTSQTSYYPHEVTFIQRYISAQNGYDTLAVEFRAFIYFTPWRKVEIWSATDFFRIGREWTLNPFNEQEPTKVFFSQSLVPDCNIPFGDTITEEWQTEYLLEEVSNAPFGVKQAMINPDTMEWYCENYGDSASYYYELSHQENFVLPPRTNSKSYKKLGTNFSGVITGRLLAFMLNDHGLQVTVPLRGIRVELREKDGKVLTQLFGTGYSNDNGVFIINYSKDQNFEGGNIELFLQFQAKHHTFNYEIIRPTFDRFDVDLFGQAVKRNHNLGSRGTSVDLDVTDIYIGNQELAFRTANFIYSSYAYTWNNVGINAVKDDLTQFKLKVLIETGGVWTGGMFTGMTKIAGGLYLNVDKPNIRLSEVNMAHESTIYHEFGHYLMWCANDHHFPVGLSENSCGIDWGTHFRTREQHLNIAFTEGWANFIRFTLDAANWENDQEYMGVGASEGNRVNLSEFYSDWPNVNNGLRSEDYIGKALYDMWDGPNKGLPEPNNENIALILGDHRFQRGVHPWDDHIDIFGNALWSIGEDNAELSFYQMVKPLYDTRNDRIKDINGYVAYLLGIVTDCNQKKGIGDCLRENRVMIDIPGFEEALANSSWLDFDNSLSSDDIFEQVDFSDFGHSMACVGSTYEITMKRNPIENTADHVIDVPNADWIDLQQDILMDWGGYVVGTSGYNLYFPHIVNKITESLGLGFNFIQTNDRSSIRFNPDTDYPHDLDMVTCGDVVYDVNNTEFTIGHSNGTSTAILTFASGSHFILREPGILRINNNSKLIIDVGSALSLWEGCTIILDGPNAILEIRGTLVLHDGASLAPVGGSNGLGFVRFNMPGIADGATARNRIQFGNNSFIRFEGSSSSTNVAEVAAHSLWIENDGNNSKHFDVVNGKIEMGSGAVLNLGMRCVFNHVQIEPINGINNFAGVYLWGHNYGLYDLKITASVNGLKSFNNVGGLPLRITDLEMQDCGQGLLIDGIATVLESPLIANGSNDFGINIVGATLRSKLSSPTISDVVVGTRFTGSSAAPLDIFSANYTVSDIGVNFSSTSTLFSRCGKYSADNQGLVGFKVAGGALEIGTGLIRSGGGGNLFYNSTTNKAFDKTIQLLKSPIYMDAGKNDLRFNAGTNNMALIGRTRNLPNAPYFKANDNLWDLPPNDAPTTGITFPNTYENYNLTYVTLGSPRTWGWASVAVGTTFYSSSAACSTARQAFCANPPTGGNGGGLPPNPRQINFGAPNQNVKNVFEGILGRQYDSVLAPDIIPDWEQALTAAEWNSNMLADDYLYIDIGLAKMNELAGDYLLNDSAFLSNPDSTHAVIASVKNTINYWIARCDTATAWQAIELLDYLKFQKAGLYFLVNDYSKASTIYSDLAENADSSLVPIAEFWVCQIDRVQQIKEHGTDFLFMDSLPECNVNYPETYPSKVLNQPKPFEKLTPIPSLHPNPANTFLTLNLNGSEFDKIEMVNTMGQKVYQSTFIKLDKGDYTFDISTLAEGLYLVTLIDSKDMSKFTKKIMVQR